MDKATFLQQAVEYIRQLQVCFQYAQCRFQVMILVYVLCSIRPNSFIACFCPNAQASSITQMFGSHLHYVAMQAVMHQLLSMGAVNGLPEDIQWAIRMLLPRKEDAKAAASEATTKTTAAEAALSQLVPSTAYLPYLLQPQQLAVLTQHAQQVGCAFCLPMHVRCNCTCWS